VELKKGKVMKVNLDSKLVECEYFKKIIGCFSEALYNEVRENITLDTFKSILDDDMSYSVIGNVKAYSDSLSDKPFTFELLTFVNARVKRIEPTHLAFYPYQKKDIEQLYHFFKDTSYSDFIQKFV